MAHYSENIAEEDLKHAVWQEWFSMFEYSTIGKIDFAVSVASRRRTRLAEDCPALWAEAKRGVRTDIIESFVQLILTMGKRNGTERLIDNENTPMYLAAFDAEKIAFVPIEAVEEIFDENDFDWTVAPSDHESSEFKELKGILEGTLSKNRCQYDFDQDGTALRQFIKQTLFENRSMFKQKITKGNFVRIFHKWEKKVLPTIKINWKTTRGILPRDFYLADLLSKDGTGLVDNLLIVLETDKYSRMLDGDLFGLGIDYAKVPYDFTDGQKAYMEFWNIYQRPPKEKFWNDIMGRVDLLVSHDVRERKGAFFTPQIWVDKSQQELASVLGDAWQDEYYIWDCCAGTGNLEVGLKNPLRVWSSTLDETDVKIMRKLCRQNERFATEHIFQFDFLNGDFKHLPESLKAVLNDQEKRHRLIIYINPPYAEATTAHTVTGTGANKSGVAMTDMYLKAEKSIGKKASNELYAQFFYRVHKEIPGCILAAFSTLKVLQATSFEQFRAFFTAKLLRLFIVPASSFENVSGDFPIGFYIWNTSVKEVFKSIDAQVFDGNGNSMGTKSIKAATCKNSINEWMPPNTELKSALGVLHYRGMDFQNQRFVYLVNTPQRTAHDTLFGIEPGSLFQSCVYFAARLCIKADWLNDRDQFVKPKASWKHDTAFKLNCLIYTIFHSQNKVSHKNGVNHWLPFYENEVGGVAEYASCFMAKFLHGEVIETPGKQLELFADAAKSKETTVCDYTLQFSEEARSVFEAGKALWTYYHSHSDANSNASLYDINEYFKGRNDKGIVNSKSDDDTYNELYAALRNAMNDLEKQIAVEVREYEFIS